MPTPVTSSMRWDGRLAAFWSVTAPYESIRDEHLVGPAGPVRTLDDMTTAEIRALERRYGCKVKKERKPITQKGAA